MAKTYNANQVIVTFAGIEMKELGEDEFVRIKRNKPAYELTMSVDGKGVREQNNDASAQIDVILLHTSIVNAQLTVLHDLDKVSKNGSGQAVLKIIDLNSNAKTELHLAPSAWIREEPEVTFARGVKEKIWKFETDKLVSFHGGH
ncbi:MAG TPA: phage protein [Steroidobacteraceae bacterium]|jgi:hypothetical protein|nr:phage protein [Steroidobacteraceae bacterium]